MVSKPDQPTDSSAVIEEAVPVEDSPEAAATPTPEPEEVVEEKKAPRKRKKPTAARKRRKPTAKRAPKKEPEPPPPPLTVEEIREQSREVKDGLVTAITEPFIEAAGALSQTVRDTIDGAIDGLLSRKRRR